MTPTRPIYAPSRYRGPAIEPGPSLSKDGPGIYPDYAALAAKWEAAAGIERNRSAKRRFYRLSGVIILMVVVAIMLCMFFGIGHA